jgi:protein involved in polysaccharide export with SLBB domain
MKKLKCVIAFLLILIFSASVFAQQFQMIPITPQPQSPQGLMQPSQPSIPGQQIQQPLQKQPILQLLPPRPPSVEKISAFEEFISQKPIEITDFQLEILKKFEGILLQYSSKNMPKDKIAVPVKIVTMAKQIQTEQEKTSGTTALETISPTKELEILSMPIIVDAGFIIGTPEAITSAFKLLGIKIPFAVSTDIRQFGYDLFMQPPSTFAPVDKVPVGPEYVIGPGDEIKITVWGKIEGLWDVVVDSDGNISLPKVGILGVTGLTFKELKDLLHKELSKYYIGFEMNVTMGALRTIRVYVIGNAERPGAYTISSLSTLINALFEAGGPSKTGTMRDIQLKRNGQIVVHFDMYDFLLKGDKTKDARLMPEDVIFIPPIGSVTAIAGSVNNPAIYELKGETKISQLLELAGGLNTIAFRGRMQVERIRDNNLQVVFETDLTNVTDKDISLQPGDVVKIFPIVQDKRIIRISGAVHREGEYGLSPNMTVKDLIALAGGLKYYAYSKEAELTRIHVTDKDIKTEKIVFNLEKALTGDSESNIPLKENDYLFVRTVPDWGLYQTVTISGEVRFPGVYSVKKCERLSSLIERAGGYTDKAYFRGSLFLRESVRQLQQKRIDEMVERIENELMAFGTSDIATALTPEDAKIKEAEIRQRGEFVARLKLVKAQGRMAIKIDQPELLRKTLYDIELEEGDSLFVPTDSHSVQVIGSVYNQTAFIYDKDKDYSDYIDLAGGYTAGADKKRVYIVKADGTASRPESSFLGISWNKNSSRWELGSQDVDSGDTIVVPENLERIVWLKQIKDVTQILYQIAVTAGVVIRVF